MKGTGSHDFEYYEEQSAYFQYTHNQDGDELFGCEGEYCDLSKEVFDLIKKRAERDVKHNRPMITRHELEELLLDAGLLKYGKTAAVMDELHWNYQWAYDTAQQEKKEVRGDE